MPEINYSFADRLLHRLALGHPAIGHMSFDLELSLTGNQKQNMEGSPVFIAGLARAGTTILMRTLYDTGLFCSLTYRDMPFVLMPVLWKRLSRHFRQHETKKERAHGDGIMVDFDSPEALEEIFWRTFTKDSYIFANHLSPHVVDDELLEKFRAYIHQIIGNADRASQKRYLSKNNNNILRLGTIRKAFPDALILIPFRQPGAHAASLHQQHRVFLSMHAETPFTEQYMQWLGHHEFGASHKPFRFPNIGNSVENLYATNDINYWLSIWINTYTYLLETAPENVYFTCFETLCKSPQVVLGDLFAIAGIVGSVKDSAAGIRLQKNNEPENVDENLMDQARKIYAELSNRQIPRIDHASSSG